MKQLLNKMRYDYETNAINDNQKDDYFKEIAELYNKNTSRGVVVTIILYNFFNTLDYFIYNEYFDILCIIRSIFTVLAFILLFFLKKPIALNNYKLMGEIWIVLTFVPICLMIYITEGSASPYYAGLLLVIVGFCLFLPCTLFQSIRYCTIIILFYIISVIANRTTPFNFPIFYNNMILLIGVSILNSTGCFFITRLRIKEFKQRYELEKIDELRREYFANVNHEIRTPLTMIILPLEKLLDKENSISSEEENDLLETIKRNALRLLGLANDILEILKLDFGKRDLKLIPLNLSIITGSVINSIGYLFEEQKQNLEYINNAGYLRIKGDYSAIEKVIIDLLGNAAKFTPAGGRIKLEVIKGKNNAIMKLSDTGRGIPKEELDSIFDGFSRGDASQEKAYKGFGIGLALARRLVREMHGTISVYSVENKGSEFTVKFPLLKDSVTAEASKPYIIENNPIESALDRAKYYNMSIPRQLKELVQPVREREYKMLIVDDEIELINFLTSLFKEEYTITRATNGKEAIEKALKEKPNIILLDLMMKDTDGITVCKDIRKEPEFEDTRIILMTATLLDKKIYSEGLMAGINDFIMKPFGATEIVIRATSAKKDIEYIKGLKHSFELLTSMQARMVRDEKIKSLGILVAGIIHEINNPLNFMRGNAALLRKRIKDPELGDMINDVYEGAIRIEKVTEGLRKFASGGEKNIEYFLLYELLEDALRLIKNKTEKIEIINGLDKKIEVAGFVGEIFQVFLNLLINSIDALSDVDRKPVIEISSSYDEKEKRVYVKFRDNGCGIEGQKLKNLFVPFYTTKTTDKGMGLGLSICRSIIKRHHGDINVNSRAGEFTEFIFDLPTDIRIYEKKNKKLACIDKKV